MTRPTPIVVVSGPPASGKSSVAGALAADLRLPLIAKDRLKEVLYGALGTGDVAWSQRLGRTAIALLYDALEDHVRAGAPVVVEANFVASDARDELARLHRRLPLAPLELHCTAPPEVLVARYRARAGSRHAGHLDEERVEEIAQAIRDGRNGPIGVGRTIVVDTGDWGSVDLEPLVQAAREHLAEHGAEPTGLSARRLC